MTKIIVSPRGESIIAESILKESIDGYASKVKVVKDYLNNHFVKAYADQVNDFGEYTQKPMVLPLDTKKQPVEKPISAVVEDGKEGELFYQLQYKFQKILSPKEERDKFLKQVIKDWYDNKISTSDTLTQY